MNLYHAVEHAKRALERGDRKIARNLIAWAERILELYDPHGALGPVVPAICCHFRLADGTIHCGREEGEPLFVGTHDERLKLCADCRRACRKELTALRAAMSVTSAVEVTAVIRDPETRAVERVEVLLDRRFVLAFRRHPSKPRMLIKSMVADLGADRMTESIWIPAGLWKQALRRAYAIFFPTPYD